MSSSMNPVFIYSFLETCERLGLTKEAAAELLQKEASDQARKNSPAFDEGYTKAADKFPGRLQPILHEGSLEKYARFGQGIRMMGKGLGMMFGGAGQASKGVASGARTAASRAARPMAAGAKRFPRSAFGAGVIASGAGGYGLHKALTRQPMLNELDDMTYFTPTGYNEAESAVHNEKILKTMHGPGISALNKRLYSTADRMAELQRAVDSDAPNSAAALVELRALKADRARALQEREQRYKQLDAGEQGRQNILNRINADRARYERDRTSIWGLPRRAWTRIRGEDPNKYYDQQILRLQERAARRNSELDIIRGQRRLLSNLYTEPKGGYKPPAQRPAGVGKFFPTYQQ